MLEFLDSKPLLYLVRQGSTEHSDTNEPLNAIGEEEAQDAAAFLSHGQIGQVFCSDVLPMLQTASVISNNYSVDLDLRSTKEPIDTYLDTDAAVPLVLIVNAEQILATQTRFTTTAPTEPCVLPGGVAAIFKTTTDELVFRALFRQAQPQCSFTATQIN